MTKDEALRLALEALEEITRRNQSDHQAEIAEEAITAIEAVLEAKDEPVAWLHRFIEGGISIGLKPLDLERHPERWEPLYTEPRPCPTCEALARTVMLDQTSHDTTPPQRTWVGLTPEDTFEIGERLGLSDIAWVDLMQAIEAALKAKNS